MTLKSSKRNFLVLVKILLDETSRNQIELAEAQCGAGGGGWWLEDKGVSHGA